MIIKESGIAEIYTQSENSFSVGRVFCQNDDCAVFEDIDTQGKVTGYYLMRKDIISKVDYHTEYLKKISKYMEFSEKHPYSNWFSLKSVVLNRENPLILQVLEYAEKENIVITIEMAGVEELEAGYVREINSSQIIFSCIDLSSARQLEEITVAVDDIVFIEFESIDNILLQYANKELK